jgi:hypothetical protein
MLLNEIRFVEKIVENTHQLDSKNYETFSLKLKKEQIKSVKK